MKTKAVANYTITDTEEVITKKTFEKDGITTCIESTKAENGFVLEVRQYGYNKKKDGSKDYDNYIDTKKVYISKTDPMASEEKPLDVKVSIKEALDNLTL
jgi:hypothetical protein